MEEVNPSGNTSAIGNKEHGLDDMDGEGAKKLSPRSQIQFYVDQFQGMIDYMDFSFETLFQQKDKEFMIAYREHVEII